jgi:lysophospholipid acyltransferase (LPLAT)-like uncharacterized protein
MFWMMNHGNKKGIPFPIGRVRTVIYRPIFLDKTRSKMDREKKGTEQGEEAGPDDDSIRLLFFVLWVDRA